MFKNSLLKKIYILDSTNMYLYVAIIVKHFISNQKYIISKVNQSNLFLEHSLPRNSLFAQHTAADLILDCFAACN